jgi:hypothetical protein
MRDRNAVTVGSTVPNRPPNHAAMAPSTSAMNPKSAAVDTTSAVVFAASVACCCSLSTVCWYCCA